MTSSETRVFHEILQENVPCPTKGEMKDALSAYLLNKYYTFFVRLTSVTGSLLWALARAHWLFGRGSHNIKIHLIDTRGMPADRIYPAVFLVQILDLPCRGVSYHDDPYHEYIAFGGISKHHVVGSVSVHGLDNKAINLLVPGFRDEDPGVRFFKTLERFRRPFTRSPLALLNEDSEEKSIEDVDIQAALCFANFFGLRDETKLAVTTMALALQKRDWNKSAL